MSTRLFGRSGEDVQRWLDEVAGTPRYGVRHRLARHHEAGIRQAVAIFGPDAGHVARQHVVTDRRSDGWTTSDRMPQDEADYVRMGLF